MNINSFCHKDLGALPMERWPDNLKDEAREIKETIFSCLTQEETKGIEPEVISILERCLLFSAFVKNSLLRHPEMVRQLLFEGLLSRRISGTLLEQEAQKLLEETQEGPFMEKMRLFRTLHLVRIAIQDISGLFNLDDIGLFLSNLAEVCVRTCLQWISANPPSRLKRPHKIVDASGLIVVAMGKLGGRELNFSSDIDIIFSFDDEKGGNVEYFQEIASYLLRLLSAQTENGIVFRTDTRLRPFGDSGPLVMGIDAMEEYYERHGRTWERYALVKARVIAGKDTEGERLLASLNPFVYRKYLDYSTIDSLREMKAMILAEQSRKGHMDNVKLGPGGIRDMEFIVQTVQLIKGGRFPSLQTPSFSKALFAIKQLGLVPEDVLDIIEEAYVFARTTENRLQEYLDQQTQLLPKSEDRRTRLAMSLGFTSWDEFRQLYDHLCGKVQEIFQELFNEGKTKKRKNEGHRLSIARLIWHEPKGSDSLELLEELGFCQTKELQDMISGLKTSNKMGQLSGKSREILDELLPELLLFSSKEDVPDKALRNSIMVLEALLGRGIYLHMLKEYPMILEHLVFLCSRSQLVTDLLRRQPILLDELMDARALFDKPSRHEMQKRLDSILASLTPGDLELWLDEIRRFKKGNELRMAACELKGILSSLQVAEGLSDLAEITLKKILSKAWHQVKGRASFSMEVDVSQSALAVIGYGKLGSREMAYSSDLDLIFLHDQKLFPGLSKREAMELPAHYAKVIQKLIFLTTTRTSQGILYEIDTRLRPNGSQGVLVSSIDGFREYQEHKAWTWEHQALVRARFICGDERVGQAFENTRKQVLCKRRAPQHLKNEILKMRNRMLKETKDNKEGFNLKKDKGGMVDIEFIAQFLVLRHAHQEKALADIRDTMGILDMAGDSGLIDRQLSITLNDIYLHYINTIHLLGLDLASPVVSESKFLHERQHVQRAFDMIFKSQ